MAQPDDGNAPRTGYIVSRFPSPSETFVLRELNLVAADDRIELVEIAALFKPQIDFTHPDAEPWLEGLHQPNPGEGVLALLGWMVRRPFRLAGSIAAVVSACIGSPARLARSLAALAPAAAVARRAQQSGLDHVHAHFATYPALAAWLTHRLSGATYSYTAHAHDIYVDQRLLRLTMPDASFVATISDYNRALLADLGARFETPIELIRCGVDPSLYRYAPRPLSEQGPVRALCIASLQEYKGHRFLIEALASGQGQRGGLGRIELDLVGDGPLRAELEDSVAAGGLSDRVRLLGSRTEQQVREHLAESDLLVLPSVVAADGQMEGLPLVLIEAAACGVPIIATNLSGIPEIVIDGETGILVEPGDAEGLAAALDRFASAPPGLNLDAARHRVESSHDARASAARIAELMVAAVSKGRKARQSG